MRTCWRNCAREEPERHEPRNLCRMVEASGPPGRADREQLLVRCRAARPAGLSVPLADRAIGAGDSKPAPDPGHCGVALFDAARCAGRQGELPRRAAPPIHPRDAARPGSQRRSPRPEPVPGGADPLRAAGGGRLGTAGRHARAPGAHQVDGAGGLEADLPGRGGPAGIRGLGRNLRRRAGCGAADGPHRRPVVRPLRAEPFQVSARARQQRTVLHREL